MAEEIDRWNDFFSVRVRNGTQVVSGFYTIVKGEVVPLLQGHVTGGSMGGTHVAFVYNQETSEFFVALLGHAGGFGGFCRDCPQ